MRLDISEAEIRQLLETLYQRYHYDFRQYAPASLKRRLLLDMPVEAPPVETKSSEQTNAPAAPIRNPFA